MNQASSEGPESRLQLRNWMVKSDAGLDPQAMILTPESCIGLAAAIVGEQTHYAAGIAVARKAIEILRETHKAGCLKIDPKEVAWLDRMEDELDDMPDAEEDFIEEMMDEVDLTKFSPADYDLPVPGGLPSHASRDAGTAKPCLGCG